MLKKHIRKSKKMLKKNVKFFQKMLANFSKCQQALENARKLEEM